MGYTTTFRGSFRLDKKLSPEHAAYLRAFSETRRMRRDPIVASSLADPIRLAAGLPIGDEGGYFTGGVGFMGQDQDASCLYSRGDTNTPPVGQPSLWCQWIPTADLMGIKWDGGEKFYRHADWLDYLLRNFLRPWGYRLSGDVRWVCREHDERGILSIVRGKVVDREVSK